MRHHAGNLVEFLPPRLYQPTPADRRDYIFSSQHFSVPPRRRSMAIFPKNLNTLFSSSVTEKKIKQAG
jgi:hypothetical protein